MQNEAVIDASWGLGEAVVSGRITPDHWVVDKVTRKPLELKAGAKQLQIVLADEGGVRETVTPHPAELSLTDAQVSEVTDPIVRLETLFGQPVESVRYAASPRPKKRCFFLPARECTWIFRTRYGSRPRRCSRRATHRTIC